MKIDIIYTYYNNNHESTTRLLNMYLDHWSNNFNNTKHNINFVIIDDHSPKKAIDIVKKTNINCNLQLYYVEDDILWNEMGARNLGASQTTSDIILFLDWDTFIYEKLIFDIFKFFKTNTKTKTCGRFYQKMYREGKVIEPKDAGVGSMSATGFSFLREHWNYFGPFDEDFAGGYGGYDLFFLNYIKKLNISRRCVSNLPVLLLPPGTTKNVYRDKLNNKNVIISKNKGITRDPTTKKIIINKQFDNYFPPLNIIRFKWKNQYENIL